MALRASVVNAQAGAAATRHHKQTQLDSTDGGENPHLRWREPDETHNARPVPQHRDGVRHDERRAVAPAERTHLGCADPTLWRLQLRRDVSAVILGGFVTVAVHLAWRPCNNKHAGKSRSAAVEEGHLKYSVNGEIECQCERTYHLVKSRLPEIAIQDRGANNGRKVEEHKLGWNDNLHISMI